MKSVEDKKYRIEWKCLSGQKSSINDEADELFSRVKSSTVFSSPAWLTAANNFLTKNRTVYELNIYLDAKLCGWLLLSVGKEKIHKVSITSIRFVGYPLNDRMSLILDSEMSGLESFLISQLCDAPFSWDVAIFNELYSLSEKSRLSNAFDNKKIIYTQWKANAVSPVLELNDRTNQELYDSYSKTLRTRLKRAEKKFKVKGDIEFKRAIPKLDDVDSYINIFKEIEGNSWKGKQAVGIFSSENSESFFRAIAKSFSKKEWLDVSLIYLNGKAISYRFGFSFKQCYLDYNLAFDDEFSKLSPGRIHLDRIITSSLDVGQNIVDSSRSSRKELHLLSDWSKELIEHYDLWIFKKTFKGVFLFLVRVWLRRLINKLVKRR